MKKSMLVLVLPFLLMCCKGKKIKLEDGDEVSISDFIEFFPDAGLPFRMADSTITRKETDSLLIGYTIFTQFVPDTVLSRQFGKKGKPKIYPLGKVVIKKNETYLFIKAMSPSRKAGYVLVFDKEQKFVASMPLVIADSDPSTSQQAEMDTKYTITTLRQKKSSAGQLLYKKDAYVFNSAGIFTLILTESNDMSNAVNTVINPIDTLPRKNKFSGDYVIDSKNFVSIRDGKKEGSLMFFIHFEKDKGTCVGELKGEALFTGASKAVFRQSNGPCVIDFNFTSSRVSIKESGACGTYRDIKCFFEGSFIKKKAPKQKKSVKKK